MIRSMVLPLGVLLMAPAHAFWPRSTMEAGARPQALATWFGVPWVRPARPRRAVTPPAGGRIHPSAGARSAWVRALGDEQPRDRRERIQRPTAFSSSAFD